MISQALALRAGRRGVSTAIILYARKSVERENSISCETQLEYCRSAVKPDERDEEILTFVDNGFSGGNVNRDGFQKMMRLVRQGEVRKVIVYKLDRISRSLPDFVNILQEFKTHRVEFVSSQEAFDTSSPYGEMIVKLLMVFAEFERTSIITRVTQAYIHRSEMGFYMGGRRPYGFELVPAVIHNIKTKKLNPIPSEVEQIQYIFEAYAEETVSLRLLLDILVSEGKMPLDGSSWTTAKLSALLKNPIYVKADFDIYDYYERHGVRIAGDMLQFTGERGAQLYGRTKHDPDSSDWSDMRLVLLTHPGVVDSGVWLKCQQKLERNRRITNSYRNPTSWLAGKVICEKCGHTMTTIKGTLGKSGEVRRYFCCTGKTHKRICTGPGVTVYAEDLEHMIDACISGKLADLKAEKILVRREDTAGINDLKLKIKAVEQSERQLLDAMLSGGFQDDLLAIANRKAAQLKEERMALKKRLEERKEGWSEAAVDLAAAWKDAGYSRKKAAAMTVIQKIVIREKGDVRVFWNL